MKTQDIKESVEKAATEVKKEFSQAQEVITKAGEKAGKYIKENPKKSAAISMGVGAAFGALLAMVFRRKKK